MIENFVKKITILEENFLSELECDDIQTKLFSIKHLWQTNKVKYFSYLPLGMYATTSEVYKNNLSYKPIMYELFGTYYEKLSKKLSLVLDSEISYHENLSYPGFHISNGLPMKNPNFHCDFFRVNEHLLGKEKLYYSHPKYFSFIIPISLPNDDSGLLTRITPLPFHRRQELIYDQELIYNKGMLATWDGDIEHSIKPFTITNDKHRITMQLHLAIEKNKGFLFW